jgi:hypothetical protein
MAAAVTRSSGRASPSAEQALRTFRLPDAAALSTNDAHVVTVPSADPNLVV